MTPVTRQAGESSSRTDLGNGQRNLSATSPLPSGTVPEPHSVRQNDVIETSEGLHELDIFMENLRRDIEIQREKNDLLEQAALEYRRRFGNDLSKYPEHVVNYVQIQRELQPVNTESETTISQPQRNAAETPAYRPRPSHMNPESYKGNNSQERVEYTQTCERVFDYSPIEFATNRSKIGWAATFLRKEPAKNWHRLRNNKPREIDTMTWSQYIEFLDNLLLQPDAKRLLDSQKYNEAKQGEKQSILSFVNYLEELEANLEPLSEKQKSENLFNKCHKSIRQKLIENGVIPQQLTRDQLISAISLRDTSYLDRHNKSSNKSQEREDSNNKGWKSQKSNNSKTEKKRKSWYKNHNTSQKPWQKSNDTLDYKNDGKQNGKKRNDEIICFNCNKPGHISPRCPEKNDDAKESDHNSSKRHRTATANRNPE